VADSTSGIDLMRRRMERASRQPPPPRRARAAEAPGPQAAGAQGPADAPAPAEGGPSSAPAPVRPPARRAPARPAPSPAPLRLAPDLPPVNLAIRVRKPLDDRLAELIHELRRDGVRTSKVELIEMLLWELPDGRAEAVRERLRRFRDCAPRGAGAPLGEPGPGPR
jgi:hypothetical protein